MLCFLEKYSWRVSSEACECVSSLTSAQSAMLSAVGAECCCSTSRRVRGSLNFNVLAPTSKAALYCCQLQLSAVTCLNTHNTAQAI